MAHDSNSAALRSADRIDLRPSAETFAAIDVSHAKRFGAISPDTWMMEAMAETAEARRHHG